MVGEGSDSPVNAGEGEGGLMALLLKVTEYGAEIGHGGSSRRFYQRTYSATYFLLGGPEDFSPARAETLVARS